MYPLYELMLDSSFSRMDLENETWNFGINIPLLDIKSRYNLKGHILVLPLVGHGNCDLKLYEVKSQIFTNFSLPIKDGREILHVDQMKVQFNVQNMKTKLYNLFNGNKVLGKYKRQNSLIFNSSPFCY